MRQNGRKRAHWPLGFVRQALLAVVEDAMPEISAHASVILGEQHDSWHNIAQVAASASVERAPSLAMCCGQKAGLALAYTVAHDT